MTVSELENLAILLNPLCPLASSVTEVLLSIKSRNSAALMIISCEVKTSAFYTDGLAPKRITLS